MTDHQKKYVKLLLDIRKDDLYWNLSTYLTYNVNGLYKEVIEVTKDELATINDILSLLNS